MVRSGVALVRCTYTKAKGSRGWEEGEGEGGEGGGGGGGRERKSGKKKREWVSTSGIQQHVDPTTRRSWPTHTLQGGKSVKVEASGKGEC